MDLQNDNGRACSDQGRHTVMRKVFFRGVVTPLATVAGLCIGAWIFGELSWAFISAIGLGLLIALPITVTIALLYGDRIAGASARIMQRLQRMGRSK